MKIKYPDYDNCTVNLVNSVYKHFGVTDIEGGTLGVLDGYIAKDYKNVVVLLLDGMGTAIVNGNLDENGFFRKHYVDTYSAVFPSTTVAATTSITSGLSPAAHGWLGWDVYYPPIDKNVTVFLNQEMETRKPAADYNVAWEYCGFKNVAARINEAGGQAYFVTPFVAPFPDSFEKICNRIRTLCGDPGKKYIYGYWNEPDHIMHEKGCYAEETRNVLRELEARVEKLCAELEDTLLVITADHGHVDTNSVLITDYPDIAKCLVRLPSIEPRALSLFVKEGMKEEFEEAFNREFGDKFILMTKEEVIERKLFGKGEEHPLFRGMVGDYMALATSDLCISSMKKDITFIGMHAGLTKDEMDIPLIIVERGN